MTALSQPLPERRSSERRQRKFTLSCRVLPDERAAIETRAASYGISVSQYLRELALAAPIARPRKRLPNTAEKLLAQVIGQLGRVGNNLNQLARVGHMSGQLPERSKLDATLRDLETVMSALVEVIR